MNKILATRIDCNKSIVHLLRKREFGCRTGDKISKLGFLKRKKQKIDRLSYLSERNKDYLDSINRLSKPLSRRSEHVISDMLRDHFSYYDKFEFRDVFVDLMDIRDIEKDKLKEIATYAIGMTTADEMGCSIQ